MDKKQIQEKVEQVFKENNLYYEWDIGYNDGVVEIHIDLGDWKHDHGYTDYLMREADFLLIDEQVTYEDGSDCYGSTHFYKYNEELAHLNRIKHFVERNSNGSDNR